MFSTFWIGWALLGLSVATILFAWSIKTRQFENSRRAALLPFDDITPEKPEGNEGKKKGKGLLLTVIALFVLSIGLFVLTISFVL